MPKPSATAKTFQAVLERTGDRLNWTVIEVPLDVAKTWGKRGQLRVKGEINGFAFRSSLFPTGRGTHMLMVNKKMQAGGKAAPGSNAKFRLEPDTEPREIKPSPELLRIFRQSKALQKYFDAMTFSTRRYIAAWVEEGKHLETRRRRAEQIAERLMETMEAERELPPLIRNAMQRNPKARTGWELMSPTHRRAHLLGIFYYRDPESRARRLDKAVEEMVAYADKRKSKRDTRVNPDSSFEYLDSE